MHEGTRDVVHGPTGVSVRLTIRIELNHDRVLSYSMDTCLDGIKHQGYTVQHCLIEDDFTLIEDQIARYINDVNGGAATKSVRVTNVEPIESR